MRGNESLSRRWLRPRFTFPIPMRGNEQYAETVEGRQAEEFPIPTRGNESKTEYYRRKAAAGEFPIPMRGNEEQHEPRDLEITYLVSDPHEG